MAKAKDEYSLFKLVHHSQTLNYIRKGIQPGPLHAHVIATNRCNQDCIICAYRRPGYQSNQNFNLRDQMSHEALVGLISDLGELGCQAIQFTGGGEPLLHPSICQALELSHRLNMATALVTNGTLLNERHRAALYGASWVRVSLDAATASTYSKVKNVFADVFKTVIRNIEAMAKVKGNTTLGISFVVQEQNWPEIYETARLTRELGADNIRISAAFTPDGPDYFRLFLEQAIGMAKRAEQLTTDEFTVFNLFNERMGELFSGEQRYPYCHSKDLVPYIGADLNIYSCCVKSYTDQGLMGSINEQSFKEFWNGRGKMVRYMTHNPEQLCKHPCMFERKNEFIDYCVKANPRHVEFV